MSANIIARNFKNSETIKGHLKLLDKEKQELSIKKFEVLVNNHEAKYPFVPKAIANDLNINPEEVYFIKGWMDSDNDRVIDYNEEVIIKIMNTVFIGFIHEPNMNKVHLLTLKDIKKYKIEKRNPVTQALENEHPMIQGSGSIFTGLYGFGDWAARISGFRDWQLDNLDDIEQINSRKETEYTLRLIKYITSNKQGAGELFLKSASKYIKANSEYVTSRFITGVGLSYLTSAPLVIPSTATAGNILFTAKEIDDFAKSIILGK